MANSHSCIEPCLLDSLKTKFAVWTNVKATSLSARWNDCWQCLTSAKNCLCPHKAVKFFFLFFFNWSQTKKIFVFCRPPLLWAYHFLSSHSTVQDKMHKILFLIFFFFFLNVAVSNPESVFHPELPVIPKPGEFKRLFIWKKTAYETQQKANNNSHFNLTACVLLLSRVSYF